MASELTIYNSLTRRKDVFTPGEPGFVGIYVCGPTVYGHSHIGHAKSYVSFDVVVRYLRYSGHRVRYVQNITDVGHLTDDADEGEDKIAKQAQRERLEPMEVVEAYCRSYFDDMDALNVVRPDISPRASGHIPEQIALTEQLLASGHAYEVNGSVYFRVSRFERYGHLSGRKLEDAQDAVRIDANHEKESSADFALWKRADEAHLMQWDSPWGRGYPGWHLECSVMSTKYLGQPFDIHGGGLENIFPHHECEVAQSEACCSKPFARYWMHNNMVTVNGTKMGKSLNNAIQLKQAFSGTHPLLSQPYSPLTVRFFIISSHYRSPLDFSDETLAAASKGLERLHSAAQLVRERLRHADGDTLSPDVETIVSRYRAEFVAAMNDDFNTPIAVGTLFEFTRELNGLLHGGVSLTHADLSAADAVFRELGEDVLGIIPDDALAEDNSELVDSVMKVVITLREQARSNRDWGTADAIRDQLAAIGIVLEDGNDTTGWRLQRS